MLNNYKMSPGVVKDKTATKYQIEHAIKSFAQVKKGYAERHMQRIHTKMEEIHGVVGILKPDSENVERILDLTSRLHKEGRLAYGIDDDASPDRRVSNLAILIGYEPGEKKAKVIEIEGKP